MPMSMQERSRRGVAVRNANRDRARWRRYVDEMKASATAPDQATQMMLAGYLRRLGWQVGSGPDSLTQANIEAQR